MDDSNPQASLRLDEMESLTDVDVERIILRDGPAFSVIFPMGSIQVTNDPSDIADDYLDAIFFSECLSPFCREMDTVPVHLRFGVALRFTMTVTDVEPFVRQLRRILPLFVDVGDADDVIRDEMSDFAEKLFEKRLRIPKLGDSLIANFIAGSRYWENKRYWHKKHPLWRWGFWRSFASDQMKTDLYTTSSWDGVWVIPGGRELVQRLLGEYGGFSPEGARLLDAASVRMNQHPHVLVGPQVTVRVPTAKIGKARKCWKRVIAPELAERLTRLDGTSQRPREDVGDFMRRVRGNWEHCFKFGWAMTENGDAIVCGDENVSFVAFLDSVDRLRPDQIRELAAEIEGIGDSLRDQAGVTAAVPLDWSLLSPEQFEDLCYEVLLRCGRFDERSFRKHGRTRSRDGGRDIETQTIGRFDAPPEKWLYQCKFTLTGSSLGGSKVAVSDVVDQYAASGFGVMTNETIDSTLYDKLDAIGRNRQISTDTWDGRRLQRFVSGRRDMMDRFFPRISVESLASSNSLTPSE